MCTTCFGAHVEDLAFECELTLPEARRLAQLGLNAVDPGVHAESLHHLADPVVARAYFDALFGAFPHEAWLLLDAQVQRARVAGVESAGVELAAAHVAECRGDIDEWVARLDAALRLDPEFGPARHDRAFAAILASDRTTARRLVEGADGFHAEAMRALLVLAEPAAVRVGRNHSCPCGSGRKSKRCCRGRIHDPELHDRMLWTLLSLWLGRFPNDGARRRLGIRLAADELDVADTDHEHLIDLLLTEPLTVTVALFDDGFLERFLATSGRLLPASDREIVERWRHAGNRLWEVLAVDEGGRAEVVDMVSGEVRTIVDEPPGCCVIPGRPPAAAA